MSDQVTIFSYGPEGGFFEPRILSRLLERLLTWCGEQQAYPETGEQTKNSVLQI